MGQDLRIRGDQVQILVVVGNQVSKAFSNIKNFDMTPRGKVTEENYLGQNAPQFDDIFMGVKGGFEIHITGTDYYLFQDIVKKRQQRITPDVQINIAGVFTFPDGTQVKRTIPDVKFGDLPENVGGRDQKISVKLDFQASDFVQQIG